MSSQDVRTVKLDMRRQAVDETIRRQANLLRGSTELHELLEAFAQPMLIINQDRRVVFVNRRLLDMLGIAGPEDAHGLFPGDLLNCEHALNDPAGCGKTKACRLCGAARVISQSVNNSQTTQECRILQDGGGALDLRLTATQLTLGDQVFTVVAVDDISDEKRRKVLERIFFHDLLNSAASMMGYSELLAYASQEEIPQIGQALARLVHELAEDIRSQRDITLAETQDLQVQWESVNTGLVLAEALDAARQMSAANERTLRLDPASSDVVLFTDKSLLSRVLRNMLKNALEATRPGGIVTAGCHANCDTIDLWVHNQGVMPIDVQLQIFQRSFSTKGIGRGIGTYSVRLLTEKYLHGRASFTSTPETGTTFTVSFPKVGDPGT